MYMLMQPSPLSFETHAASQLWRPANDNEKRGKGGQWSVTVETGTPRTPRLSPATHQTAGKQPNMRPHASLSLKYRRPRGTLSQSVKQLFHVPRICNHVCPLYSFTSIPIVVKRCHQAYQDTTLVLFFTCRCQLKTDQSVLQLSQRSFG